MNRIFQREHSFSAGMSVLLDLPAETRPRPPEEQPPPPAPVEPVRAPPLQPSGLNRGALLARLQGTHQANLHRGFYTLLNSAVPTVQMVADPGGVEAAAYRVQLLDVEAIAPNPYLPAPPEDEEAMELLAQSIREQGVLEPLQVHPAPEDASGRPGTYWIISGERRRQAALRVGLKQVPTIVKEIAPRAGLQIFLAQSLHAHPLSLLDYAGVIRVLTEEMGMSPLQVASRVGAAVEDVEAELGLLTLDEAMQQSLREDRLSSGQAKVLLDAPDEETRRELWEYALRYRPAPERMRYRLERMIEGEPLPELGEEAGPT